MNNAKREANEKKATTIMETTIMDRDVMEYIITANELRTTHFKISIRLNNVLIQRKWKNPKNEPDNPAWYGIKKMYKLINS